METVISFQLKIPQQLLTWEKKNTRILVLEIQITVLLLKSDKNNLVINYLLHFKCTNNDNLLFFVQLSFLKTINS